MYLFGSDVDACAACIVLSLQIPFNAVLIALTNWLLMMELSTVRKIVFRCSPVVLTKLERTTGSLSDSKSSLSFFIDLTDLGTNLPAFVHGVVRWEIIRRGSRSKS